MLPEEAGIREGIAHVEATLAKAKELASEASWADCVREAGGALGVATDVLARSGKYEMLRDLHLQIGVCLTLDDRKVTAGPHFTTATLLDEAQPEKGLFRKEAEDALDEIRGDVLQRERGKVKITSAPAGAEVFVDGRAVGKTPLEVEVRAGDHFLTARRFRFEPSTEIRFLQPTSDVHLDLDPARRATLGDQLAALSETGVGRADPSPPSPFERALGRAAWSRAEELVRIEPVGASATAVRLSLWESATGRRIKERVAMDPADDDRLRDDVCALLGEKCPELNGGPPWYIWPIIGSALLATGITVGFVVDAERNVRLCPTGGCP